MMPTYTANIHCPVVVTVEQFLLQATYCSQKNQSKFTTMHAPGYMLPSIIMLG